MTPIEHLAALITSPVADCIEWDRGRDWDGYGIMKVDGRSRRAHRIAWEIATGAAPLGVVMHTCDNPPCVNPAHLADGSIAENNADRQAKGRSADRRGSRCPTHKLTDDQVREIDARLRAGDSHSVLGREFRVSREAISRLSRGETWAHLTGRLLERAT